jgi:hypothetical protein
MTKEEIAELIDKMPQDMDVNDFIHELVNRALAVSKWVNRALSVKRKWVGLTDDERKQIVSYINDPVAWVPAVEAKLKEKNT